MKKRLEKQGKPVKYAAASSLRLALEARLLFDGAVVATAEPVVNDKTAAENHQIEEVNSKNSADFSPAFDGSAETDTFSGHTDSKDAASLPFAAMGPATAGHSEPPVLIIVDPRTPGAANLLQKPPVNTEVRAIDPSRDGYQQISAILQNRESTEEIQLFTVDKDGQQWLGATRLDAALNAAKAETIAGWGDRLAPNANIVLHAGGAVNSLFVHQVHGLTGARVSWLQDSQQNGLRLADTGQAGLHDRAGLAPESGKRPVNSLVFIDMNVKDYQTLLDGIDSNSSVFLLDPAKDEISQITQVVSRYDNIGAVHIIGHGSEGKLKLGGEILDQNNLAASYQKELTKWGRHLAPDADILLYGCDVAAGSAGQRFVNELARITGADVAASSDTTGAANLGGDWTLEKRTGQIDSRIVISGQAQQNYAGVLRTPNTPTSPGILQAPTSSFTAKLVDTFNVNGATASITKDVIGGQQVIQLTKEENNKTGSAWSKYQIDLTQNFTIDFDVYLGTLKATGADGIAFALQNIGPNVTGGFGGGLGVQNISKAVAIEFDTWNNGANTGYAPVGDIANDHISMYRPTTSTYAGQSLGSSPVKDVGEIETGQWFNCVVNWNAATKTLSYSFGGPAGTVTDSAVIDPNTVFGDNNVFFGWTASTGGSRNDQRVAINSITNLSPEIDLNGSTAGDDNTVTFTENGPGVRIADPTALIGDPDNADMQSAKIVLTDKQALDRLLVNGSAAASGTVNGLNYTLVDDGSSITINLTGPASKAVYASAIRLISFDNLSEKPSAVDRHVSVTVNDGNVDSSPAIATVRVLPVNDPPQGADKTITINEDSSYIVAASDFGFSDPAETPADVFAGVLITQLPPASQGAYKLNGVALSVNQVINIADINAGSLTFTPTPNVAGSNLGALGFRVQDNGGTANGGVNTDPTPNQIKFNITQLNDAPVANPRTLTGTEDNPVPLDLTGTDIEGPIATVTVSSLPPVSSGILYRADGTTPVLAGEGLTPGQAATLIFKPAANFTGTVTIPFTVADNEGLSSTVATANITIMPVNDPPVAIPDNASTQEDEPVALNLTGSDVDSPITAVTVTALPPASRGILYLPDGITPVQAGVELTPAQAASLIFKPAPNFSGTVAVPFTVTDDKGAVSAPASALIDIAPVNDPPAAVSSSANTPEDTPVRVNLAGTDIDGAVVKVTVTVLPPASNGILFLPDGFTPVQEGVELTPAQAANLIFKPALNFNGVADIAFTVKDNNGAVSQPGSFVIDVEQENDDPVATPVTLSSPEDTPLPVSLTGTDVEGPIKGVTINSLPPASEGILYLSDGVTPVQPGVELTPEAAADLKFVPAPNFNGSLVIPFTVKDSAEEISSPPANLTIIITPLNDPPVALAPTESGAEDALLPISLTGSDVDGTVARVTVTGLPPASQGILYLPDGRTPVTAGIALPPAQAANLIFKPAPNFNGIAEIPFTVTDDKGAISDPVSAQITITPVNDPPVAISGSANTPEDTPVQINLTGTDIDGAVTSVTVLALPENGMLYLPDGITPVQQGAELTPAQAANLIFIPESNFNGLVNIAFTVRDNNGGLSDSASFVVDVEEVDDDPAAVPAMVSGPEDKPLPVSLTGSDADGPITAVTITELPSAAQGILIKADGQPVEAGVPLTPQEAANLTFVPAPNFTGPVVIPFTVRDSVGQISSPPADLILTITPVNDPPVAISTSVETPEDSPVKLNLSGTDLDGTVATVTISTLPSPLQGILYLSDGKTPVAEGAALAPAQAASLIFKPAPNFNGTLNLPFTVTDNEGTISNQASAQIMVTPINDPPVAISGSANTPEDIPVKINLTGTDVDGTVIGVTVTALPPASQGELYLPDGVTPVRAGVELTSAQAANLIFKPAANYNGLAEIAFKVKDSSGADSEPGQYVIDVNFVDDDPVATPAVINGVKNTPLPVSLTGTDAEGPITAVTIVDLPPASQGILSKADGTPVIAGMPLTPEEAANLIFMPAPNFTGSLAIPFTVRDSVRQISSPPAKFQINISEYVENIGALINLSNPTPPLFPVPPGGAFQLTPLSDNALIRANESPYQFPPLSLYQDLPHCDLYLTGSLRNHLARERQYFSFTLPPNTFRHSNPSEELEYQATRRDGRPLPDWLHFDAKRLKFSGTPPKGEASTDVTVIARDHCGNKVYASFSVRVNKENNQGIRYYLKNDAIRPGHEKASQSDNNQPLVSAKPSFNDQVCYAGKLGRLMESRALLDSLSRL